MNKGWFLLFRLKRYISPFVLAAVFLFAVTPEYECSADASAVQVNLPVKNSVAALSPVIDMTLVSLPRELAPFSAPSRINYLNISEDTQWSGSVLVQGMVTVSAQATLTVLPGTVVRFNPESGITVLGRIVVKGTSDQPVSFSSIYMEPAPSDWYGIVLTASSKKNIFEQLKIQGAESAIFSRSSSLEIKSIQISDSLIAIKLTDSIARINSSKISTCASGLVSISSETDIDSLVVEKCRVGVSLTSSSFSAEKLKISSSSQTGLIAEKSHLRIDKSLFSGNQSAAVIVSSDGTLQRSRFLSNAETAILLRGSLFRFSSNQVLDNRVGMQLEDNLSAIWGNSIYGNSGYNILYLGDDNIYAGGNWFGTPVSSDARKTLFSSKTGSVIISPTLSLEPAIDLQ